jgi:exodeoxyribonuclease V alpha subunit
MKNVNSIPQISLKKIYRHKDKTGIPIAGESIINMKIPKMAEYSHLAHNMSGIGFVHANDKNMVHKLLPIYRKLSDRGELQILTAKNVTCDKINLILHNEYKEALEYKLRNEGHEGDLDKLVLNDDHSINKASEIFVGEPLLWKGKNQHDRGIYNGSLGTITNIFNRFGFENIEKEMIALAQFDGKVSEIFTFDIGKFDLGYAMTAHKSQGTEFERVIVIIEETGERGIVDNSWIYTAITRAKKQVVLIGDKTVFDREVKKPPRAFERVIGLNFD